MTEIEEQETAVLRRYYSLFEYNDCIESEEDDKEDKSYSLTVICSDIPGDLELEVRKLLSQKLSKSAVYYDAGSVTHFDIGEQEAAESWSCYYCMLKEKEIREDGGNIKYIVCFLAPESEMLENFTHDLDLYCGQLSSHLCNKTDVGTPAKQYLEKWHEQTLDYLCRCVQLIQNDVKFLLYCALVNGCLKVNGGDESVSSDLLRFVKLCNMSDIFTDKSLDGIDKIVDVSLETDLQPTIKIDFEDGKPVFQDSSCTKFCDHWSKAINSVDGTSPGQIRQAVEAFRAKFIHSINTMKRLLTEAHYDYYAYYRAYRFIQNSGNTEILMNYAHLDEIPEVREVFSDLKKYIDLKS